MRTAINLSVVLLALAAWAAAAPGGFGGNYEVTDESSGGASPLSFSFFSSPFLWGRFF
jgi:hypothetical protein